VTSRRPVVRSPNDIPQAVGHKARVRPARATGKGFLGKKSQEAQAVAAFCCYVSIIISKRNFPRPPSSRRRGLGKSIRPSGPTPRGLSEQGWAALVPTAFV